MSGKLYIVGTPIGNLSDFSPRAREILGSVDFIAAEDTRVTRKLLTSFDLHTPMVSYFEHNKHQRGEEIVARILAGENCAIVTDAGMPCISDPGEDLVALCAEKNIPMESVPGPSAVITALAISGLSTARFSFEGFLSVTKSSRNEHLAEIKDYPNTMIFYEAPHKLLATLKDMLAVLGDRRIALARELTKLHEEVVRTTLSEAVRRYEENPPRGEFVLVVEGAPRAAAKEYTFEEAVALARSLAEQGQSASAAAKAAAKESGLPRSDIYRAMQEK